MLIRSLMDSTFLRSPDGGGDPAPAPAPAPSSAPAPAQSPKTFTLEYVQELREEAKTWRQKANGHETAFTTAKAEAERVKAEADAAIAAAKTEAETRAAEAVTAAEAKANDRVIRAELRALAIKAGMVDLDALKLLDASALKINDAGDVEGAEALIEAAKTAKPYLFGGKGTGNPAQPPQPKPTGPKAASEMSDEEFDAAIRNKGWRT